MKQVQQESEKAQKIYNKMYWKNITGYNKKASESFNNPSFEEILMNPFLYSILFSKINWNSLRKTEKCSPRNSNILRRSLDHYRLQESEQFTFEKIGFLKWLVLKISN